MSPLSMKQLQFVSRCTARWNLAHGPVSSGKTVGTLFAFMHDVYKCPDSQIWMIGHTSSTIYDNAIRLLLEERGPGIPDPLAIYRPYCTWLKGERELRFRDKIISTTGAKDSGAIGAIQGKTMSLVYCDEMTLYPESIIDMIDTRLRNPHSKGYGSMNPSHPSHKLKKWIDQAEIGNPDYFSMQFMLDDNPYLDNSYKNRIKNSLSGIFYKRNYLGIWCLAEGAIFDFFEKDIYVVDRPPKAAEYWIAGIDDGTINNFACMLIGINTGQYDQTSPMRWVEKEFVWDHRIKGRQLTMSEKADCVVEFLQAYSLRGIYVDPSAAALKLELRKRGLTIIDADNDVISGITYMTSEMRRGALFICSECKTLIREIESYVWDPKAAEKGYDEPLKKDDHCIDATRYAIYSHKISVYDYNKHRQMQQDYLRSKYQVTRK
jgi:PBSX family phage terminase large subunit